MIATKHEPPIFPKADAELMKEAARAFDPFRLPNESKWYFDTAHGGTFDAAESAFLSRQLEFMRPGILEVRYPELRGSQLVPVDATPDNGAEQFTYEFFDYVGQAKIVANLNTEAPVVEVKADQGTVKIHSVIDAYRYSIQEARNAMFARVPLIPRKAMACREVMERTLDSIIFVGATIGGLKGILTLSGTQTYTAPNGNGASDATWEKKSSDEIVADLNGMANRIVVQSNGVEVPDTILLPLSLYTLISSKRMGDGSDTTILQHFLQANPYITTVEWTHYSESATTSGVAGAWTGRRAVCYRRDPNKVAAIMPQPFEQLPPQAEGYVLITHCHARTAGVVAYYPQSICYTDSI